MHGLPEGLHRFGLSEVCRPRTEGAERAAIVNALEYERNNKSFRGIINEVVANSTNTSDFQESSFADEVDVLFHREILV